MKVVVIQPSQNAPLSSVVTMPNVNEDRFLICKEIKIQVEN